MKFVVGRELRAQNVELLQITLINCLSVGYFNKPGCKTRNLVTTAATIFKPAAQRTNSSWFYYGFVRLSPCPILDDPMRISIAVH